MQHPIEHPSQSFAKEKLNVLWIRCWIVLQIYRVNPRCLHPCSIWLTESIANKQENILCRVEMLFSFSGCLCFCFLILYPYCRFLSFNPLIWPRPFCGLAQQRNLPVTFIFIASKRVTSWEVSRLRFLRRSNYLSMVDSVSLSKCRSENKIWVYFQSIFIYYIQRCLRFMSEITPWGTRKAAFVEVLTGNKSYQSCDLLIFNSN